jgi:hypothetical protein
MRNKSTHNHYIRFEKSRNRLVDRWVDLVQMGHSSSSCTLLNGATLGVGERDGPGGDGEVQVEGGEANVVRRVHGGVGQRQALDAVMLLEHLHRRAP